MEEQQQAKHWQNAQSLEVGLDIIAAARSQLRLLSAVDSHPLDLYRGPALDRAISRYENCWLPLLAGHGPNASSGLPLIPPLDCAWIWHCHRLNPVQYISDCKACYGKRLDAPKMPNDSESEAVAYSRQLWDSQFPDEEYEVPQEDPLNKKALCSRKIEYDLHAAVERQSSFFYQVSRPHMEEERFLQAALHRYKGFLYLLKLSGLQLFLVPTYDIDLMWHSHQSNPGVYKEDTIKLLGRVLNHDDTDSDRTEGQKLDTGFNKTRDLWQHTFGSSYERAGAMYRGEAPASPRRFPCAEHPVHLLKSWSSMSFCQDVPGVEPRKTVQVFVTVQKARNLRTSQDGMVAVQLLFQKRCSMLKLETSWTKATSNPEWNGFWSFECEEATEGIHLELRSQDLMCCNFLKKSRMIGEADIPWQTILSSPTLSFDGWVPLLMKSQPEGDQKPISLRVSISITPPGAAPVLLRMEHSSFRNRKKNSISKIVYDHKNEKKFVVKVSGEGAGETFQPSSIQVYSIGQKESPVTLLGVAKYIGPATMAGSQGGGSMHLAMTSSSVQDYQPDLQATAASGDSVVVLHGRKCQYEVPGSTQAEEAGFLTVIRQSAESRVGKATALLNWKSGAMEVLGEQCGVMVVLLCAIMAAVTKNIYHIPPCNLKSPLQKLKGATRTDDWGAVILNRHGYFQSQDELRFCPWYSMSSNLWMSMFYNAGLGCLGNWAHSLRKLSGSCGTCGGGGCGGCGAGGCGNSLKSSASGGRGGGCGGCGSGGCGGCGAGGCGNRLKKNINGIQGGGCGGCGSGGCMNGVKGGGNPCSGSGIGHLLRHITSRGQGGGCGGCGAGGCGNSSSTALLTQGGKCGGCGAGGCGNNVGPDRKAVKGGNCGGCGAGGCGNSIKGADKKAVQGGKCGGCGAGGCGAGCGNSIMGTGGKGVQGGKCGGCGAGGCGNSIMGDDKKAVQGGKCGGCGAGGCGNGIQNQAMTA